MIKVDSISHRYESTHDVLRQVTFSIQAGEFVSLMGHNGSGKSTLAKLLGGLLELKEGTIHIDGILMQLDNLQTIRQKLGIVFQNPDNQFIGATVADDLAFGLENRKVPHAQMQSIINTFSDQVGMKAFLHQEPSSLSGGQKQRVAIAGVLAMQPKILLLDEATAMLDPKGKLEIKQLILRIKEQFPQLTILAITHDVEEAVLSDRVLVLKEGQLVFDGQPDTLFKAQELVNNFKLDMPFVYQLYHAFPDRVPKQISDLSAWAKTLCQ